MMAFFQLDRTKFNKRVFTVFDEDGSGQIDFREFVASLWNYCTLGPSALMLFAFDLYDSDSSGNIDKDEMKMMLKEVYGDGFENNDFAQRILAKIDGFEIDGEDIDIRRFKEFTKRYPGLLFPCFKMQVHLQQRILGERFWTKVTTKRLKMNTGAVLSIDSVLRANVMQGAVLHKLVDDVKTAAGGSMLNRRAARRAKGDVPTSRGANLSDLLQVSGSVAKRRQLQGVDMKDKGQDAKKLREIDKQLKAKTRLLDQKVGTNRLNKRLAAKASAERDGGYVVQ